MRMSATGRSEGFTLVELLVVVAVVGLGLGLVALVPDGGGASAAREAERLRVGLERGVLEGLWGTRRMGWSRDAAGYRFWVARENAGGQEWIPAEEEGPFRSRRYPAGFVVEQVLVDGRPVAAGEVLALQGQAPPLFAVALAAGGQRLWLRANALGEVQSADGDGAAP